MADLALSAARVFDGDTVHRDVTVLIEAGRVRELVRGERAGALTPRVELDGLLAPGFVDLQVNGGGGVLFNDHPGVEAIRTIGAAHRRYGTTAWLPTLISDSRETMTRAIDAVREARACAIPGVLGIHLEGPYLNAHKRGIHDARQVRAMEPDALDLLTSLGDGVTLVTLAPETVAPGTIEALCARGVIVCAGHTAASYAEIERALGEGLRGFTHLFNAMTPLASREPGVVGAALEHPNSGCGLIVDGHHVHPATLRIAIAAKARGHMFLVTDAMPLVGTSATRFELHGQTILAADGRCTNAEGVLAGSSLDMASAVRNAVHLLGLEREEALRMASLYPARFAGVGHEHGRIAPGYRADLVLLDDDLRAVQTWTGGEPATPA